MAAGLAIASDWAGDAELRPTADQAFMSDPSTVYPVTIDPRFNNVGTGFDTYVESDFPNTKLAGAYAWCRICGMTGLPSRLSAVTLGARDLPKLRTFYHGLGWPEVPPSDDGWVGFLLGGVLLALYPLDELAAEAAPDRPAAPAGWSGITLACNVDSAEQVDTAFAAAVAAGATSVAEPVDRPWGGRSAYVADPEGNRWEIAWAASAVFDDRGALTAFG